MAMMRSYAYCIIENGCQLDLQHVARSSVVVKRSPYKLEVHGSNPGWRDLPGTWSMAN